jgi:hypothetical protein
VSAPKKWKPRVSKEWLEREYISNGRDCTQIGAELGKDQSTVRGWLVTYGIPTRPRGANGGARAHAFRKGQPSAFKGRRHTPEAIAKVRASTVADGRVPYLVNGQPWMTGRTGTANPNWKGGATPERQEFYRSPEWKAAALAVWVRADAKCERCGLDYRTARRTGQKFHVHHIVSFAVRELRTEMTNLVLLCPGCHRWVHSRANVNREFLAEVPAPFDLEELDEAS